MLMHRGLNPRETSIGDALCYADNARDLYEADKDIVLGAIAEWSNEAF